MHIPDRANKPLAVGNVFIPVLHSWFQPLPKMSLLMQPVCCYGFRQEILSQNVQNREAVSRLCFPRSHATMRTHSLTHTCTHISWRGRRLCVCSADSLLPLSVSDPISSCREMCSLTVPLRRDMWVNSSDQGSGVLQHSLVYLTYHAFCEGSNISQLENIFYEPCSNCFLFFFVTSQQQKYIVLCTNVPFSIVCSCWVSI